MQMMHVLKPIASDVLECLTQLFDYYLYAVRIMYILSIIHYLLYLIFL